MTYPEPMTRVPTVLSIAGSDSGGGAGIQADLKAFARCGVHGMTAITALTVQNTVEVRDVVPVAPETIIAQVRAVAEDLGVDAVKVGMLGSPTTTAAVAQALAELPDGTPVVVDPVMVAESGGRLLERTAEEALRALILPLATVVTPNVAEARVLAGAGEDAPLAARPSGACRTPTPKSSSSTSSVPVIAAAPSLSRLFVPCATLEVTRPGTAATQRPRSFAKSAVIRLPLGSAASTTRMSRASPAMIRLRAGKLQRYGSVPGGSSDSTSPRSHTRWCSPRCRRG